MNVFRCFTGGLGRVLRAPALIFWVFLASLVVVLPLTAAMRDILKESLGTSLAVEKMRQTFDLDWYGEYSSGADGLAGTFGPSVVGILPVLGNLESLLDGKVLSVDRTILAAGIIFLLAWAFLGGGIVFRYSRPEQTPTRREFMGICGEYFFRFVRLLVISLVVYWAIFRGVSGPLQTWVTRLTRDVTVERTAMLCTLAAYAIVGLLLVIGSISLDYAKIAMVVEERSSALLAFLRGLRFFLSHPAKTLGLYALLLLAGVLLIGIYSLVAPGPNQSGDTALLVTFGISECYIIARIILRLWFLAGQTLLVKSVVSAPAPAGLAAEVPPPSSEVAA
jgi:hypothetical protein